MGRVAVGDESDTKSKLVKEICNISSRAITCAHWHHRANPNKSPFIDWYLLLHVKENVGIDVIRKQYHKLALQLHPDKNKHPKAETAFKLLSEAHACLSDNERRATFDLERGNNFCIECNRVPRNNTEKKGLFPTERLRSNKIVGRMKDIRARFMEESRVIEDCLETSKSNTPIFGVIRKEIPVFNPSDYLSQGYPHHCTRNNKKFERLWCLRTGSAYEQQGKGKYDSPIFECRSERGNYRFKSVPLTS